jgi:hypothetical protein
MKKFTLVLAATIFALSCSAYAESKKIVKWVDAKGVTHYGDKLPAQEAGRNNAEMNTQGVVLKHNVKVDKKDEALDQQKSDQERKDKILLASYTKAEEIDLARDRSLQMDQAALQALVQQKENLAGRTTRNNKTAEGFRTRNKALPPYLRDELNQAKTEAVNIDKQIVQRKLNLEATRKHFAAEKMRFASLKQPSSVDTETASLEATLTMAPTAAGSIAPEQTAKK